MTKILEAEAYEQEIKKILEDGALSEEEKANRLLDIKNKEDIDRNLKRLEGVPESVKDKIAEFHSSDDLNQRIKNNLEYEQIKAMEEEEKSGSLVEIFLDHITFGDVTVPLPTLRFYHLLERRYPSNVDKKGNVIKNEELISFGIDQEVTAFVCYCLSNAWEKGFEKKPDKVIQEEADEWFSKFGIMQHQIVAAVNVAMAHELNKKKLKQKVDLRKHTQ